MKDGGPESPVTGYFLIEWKPVFSIVLLHFGKGQREAFHSHAFNALTFWLRGQAIESVMNRTPSGRIWNTVTRIFTAGRLKYTPRWLMHRFEPESEGAWAVSFRGPWAKTWEEYRPHEGRFVTLTHGRKVVA